MRKKIALSRDERQNNTCKGKFRRNNRKCHTFEHPNKNEYQNYKNLEITNNFG